MMVRTIGCSAPLVLARLRPFRRTPPGTEAMEGYIAYAGALTRRAIPIAAPAPTMYDLEGELEKGLPLAVECILDAVKPKTSPDKVKLDAAKWLIDDRRRWRIQTAEQANRAGEVPADPAMAQLAGILRLVPDQEVG